MAIRNLNSTYSRDPYKGHSYQALRVVEKRESKCFTDFVVLHHKPLTQLHKFAGSRRTDLPILMDKEGFWCATNDAQNRTLMQYVGALSPPKKGNVNIQKKMNQCDRHYLTGRLPSNFLNVELLASSPNTSSTRGSTVGKIEGPAPVTLHNQPSH